MLTCSDTQARWPGWPASAAARERDQRTSYEVRTTPPASVFSLGDQSCSFLRRGEAKNDMGPFGLLAEDEGGSLNGAAGRSGEWRAQREGCGGES